MAKSAAGRPYQRTSDGRWVVVVRDPEGHRRSLYGPSQAAVLERRDEFLSAMRGGLNPPSARLTVGRHLVDWLEDRRGKVRPATWISYEGQVRIHLASLRAIPLTKLKPADVRRVLEERRAAGMSPRSVGYTLTVLRMALRQAVSDGLIARNVAIAVAKPKVERVELVTWTPEEARAFVDATAGDELGALWAVLVGCGLRLGEGLGLRWADIDLAAGRLRVTGAIRPLDRRIRPAGKERLQRVPPKTDAGWRTIAIPAFVAAALSAHRAARPANVRGLVFVSRLGTPVDPRNASRSYDAAIARTGARRIRIHDLRHSTASLLLSLGYSLQDVKQLLGHEDISTTSNIYGHLVEARSREVAAGMDLALGRAAR